MASKVNARPKVKRTFKVLFLDKLRELSGGDQKLVNNRTLQTALEWKEERYTRIKDELVRENKIVATRGGPGGAVTLADSPKTKAAEPLHVFVSYSHQDEEIKNELVKHLTPLKRLSLIADWHERKIEAGDKWEQLSQRI